MDITDGASSLAGSSSGPGPETAQPAAPNEPSESNEVSVYEDLHIVREIVLEGDRPDDLSDDDSAIGVDDDSDASSVASSAVAMEDAEPEPLEPPAEDHSVQRLEAHKEPVFAVAVCAARPEIFATGGGDDVAHLWRVGEAAPSCRFEGHADSISSLGFSADGTMLATAGLDGTVRVWSADGTGQLIAALEGPSQGVTWLAWHTRGAVLLAGSEDATAWMWKLPEGNVMQIFSAHSAAVTYGAFVNNGRNVVTASEDGTVRVWNPRTGTVDHCLQAGLRAEEPRPVTCLAAHNSQPVFMFGTDEGGLKMAHAESGKLLATLPGHDLSIESAGFCDALQLAASAGMDGKLIIWDLGSLAQRHSCMHPAGVIEMRWLKESPMLLSCAVSRELRLWDGRSGECLQTLTGHTAPVLTFDVGYTSQGIYVVSGSDDRTARVWQPRL